MNLNDKILDALTLLDIQSNEVESSITEVVRERLVELLNELMMLAESSNVTELPTLMGRRTIQRLQSIADEIERLSRQLSTELTRAQHRAISGVLGEVSEMEDSPFDVMEILALLGVLGASSNPNPREILPYSPELARDQFNGLYLKGLPRRAVWGRWMDQAGAGVQSRTAALLSEEMASAFDSSLTSGGLQQRVSTRVQNRLRASLQDTLLGASSSTLRASRGIVESEAMTVSNAFLEALVRRNPGVFRQRMVWSAILDSRVCRRCGLLHGTLVDAEEGLKPPLHIFCRCRRIPLIRGEPTPTLVSFGDWLSRQSRQTQESILGVRGTELFRSGQVQIRDFVDFRGRVVPRRRTLGEIERRI